MREDTPVFVPIEVPDRILISGVSRMDRALRDYLAARAEGRPPSRGAASEVRFIPHTPESRAAYLQRLRNRSSTEKPSPSYAPRRTANPRFSPNHNGAPSNAAPKAQVTSSGEGNRRVAPVVRTTPRDGSVRRKAASRKARRRVGAPLIRNGRSRSAAQPRLLPDFSNLDAVIAHNLGLR